ncbi:hypothetical protein [Acidithrix sp. C25]|uniref:hypothetical protein n=1 Tax=Acidithrix sp. C25 TaxID=1671482 RepID=UPI00191BA5AB|nr:hypothetical protein [Acidithrix sp. C25]
MVERALCKEIWGGNCREVVLYPLFRCVYGHSPSKSDLPTASHTVVVDWDGETATVDVANLIRTVLSPFIGEKLIAKLLENLEIDAILARDIAQAPNLPFERFLDCLNFRQIPRRSLELMVHEMLSLLEVSPKVSWLSGYSKNEVPDTLWEIISNGENEAVIGPVPDSVADSNLEKLAELIGDPVFHHSLIVEICRRSLPKTLADAAYERFRVSPNVDKWDLRESHELILDTYGS